jgi:hypothetical protein
MIMENEDKNPSSVTTESPRPALEWRPMSIEPPVNQSVLIYIPNAEHYGEGIYRAIWVESDWHPDKPRHWQTTGLHHGRDCLGDYQPTHWMPLPDPPSDGNTVK